MPREHVAIVNQQAAWALKQGFKRIETRFYRYRRAPCGQIERGDIIHFKIAGGSFIGTSKVSAVREYARLNPARLLRLRKRYNDAVCAPARYWAARRASRFGVLIWVGPLNRPPENVAIPRQYGGGWVVLGET
ncbi:MAG: hypothetical protein KAY37_03075 [Phycisphaerae bacterium]|nr:hypothetical protein [Phycisphaerae bacterium]